MHVVYYSYSSDPSWLPVLHPTWYTTAIALHIFLPGNYKIQVLVSRAGEEGERSNGKVMDGHFEVHLAEVAPADISNIYGGESVGHLIKVIVA